MTQKVVIKHACFAAAVLIHFNIHAHGDENIMCSILMFKNMCMKYVLKTSHKSDHSY